MRPSRLHVMVFVTVPNRRVGRKIAREALTARLIACANLLPGVESHYWWKGTIESGSELLLVLKTTRARLKSLEALVRQHHPYETPEFVVTPIIAGSEPYLDWIDASIAKPSG